MTFLQRLRLALSITYVHVCIYLSHRDYPRNCCPFHSHKIHTFFTIFRADNFKLLLFLRIIIFLFFSSLNHPHSLWISKVILCLFSIFVTSILWTSSRTSLSLMLTHLIINFQVLHVRNKKPGRYTLGFASVVHSKD